MINNNFIITWNKIFLFIIFSLIFLLHINYLITTWSLILFIRTFLIGFILILFCYKFIQLILLKYNIIINIIFLEFIYKKLQIIYNLRIWYFSNCIEMDRIYLSNNQFQIKYLTSKWPIFLIYMIFITFDIFYQMLLFDCENIMIIRYIFILPFICYLIYIIILDYKYVIPNLQQFNPTNILNFPEDGLPKPSTRNLIFSTGRRVGGVLNICLLCVMATLCTNWGFKEHFPDRKAPLEYVGDVFENNPKSREVLDNYFPKKDLPPIDKPTIKPNNPQITHSGPSITINE